MLIVKFESKVHSDEGPEYLITNTDDPKKAISMAMNEEMKAPDGYWEDTELKKSNYSICEPTFDLIKEFIDERRWEPYLNEDESVIIVPAMTQGVNNDI